MDQVHVVRHKVLVEGRTQRSVAREMGLSRTTVGKYVGQAAPGRKAEVGGPRPRPVWDAVAERVQALLTDSVRWTGGKQRLTATRLHELLLAEGKCVGVTVIKAAVAEWKRQRREVFVPLTYRPGDLAEVDFFVSTVRSFKTEKDALDHLITARQQQKDGTLTKPSVLTLAAWLPEWLESLASRLQLAPSSVMRYMWSIKRITPIIGTVKLRDLTPRHIDKLIASLQANGDTRSTVQLVCADLRCALRSARKAKLVAFDVSGDVEAPKPVDRQLVMRSLTDDEARRVIGAAQLDESLGILWTLGLTTGMRRGEMLALRWSSIDLSTGATKIEAGIQRATARTGWRLGSLKTGSSRREIVLTPEAIDGLRAHQRRQKEWSLRCGRPWDASAFIFHLPEGGFLTPDRAAHAYRRFIAAHDLPKHRLHDLQHTCATLLLKHGESVAAVARQLGHASPSMTLNRYAHVLPDQKRGIADRMSKLLAG